RRRFGDLPRPPLRAHLRQHRAQVGGAAADVVVDEQADRPVVLPGDGPEPRLLHEQPQEPVLGGDLLGHAVHGLPEPDDLRVADRGGQRHQVGAVGQRVDASQRDGVGRDPRRRGVGGRRRAPDQNGGRSEQPHQGSRSSDHGVPACAAEKRTAIPGSWGHTRAMATASPECVRRELGGLAPGGAREFALQAARVLARAVPFDGFCVLTMDPATHLPTNEIVQNGLPAAAMARLTEIELSGADVNTFAALARADRHAAALRAATDGDLDRSRRHRELRRPHGLGDELRAALVVDGTTWGALTLLRGGQRPDFAAADTALVAAVAAALADGLRRATLTEAVAATRAERGIGVLALAGDDTVVAVDPAAERWLAQLREAPVTAADADR